MKLPVLNPVATIDEPAASAIRAAYLGASNGDQPEFYELFCAAVDTVGIRDTRHVPSDPSAADRSYLEGADLVLLAGGDPVNPLQTLGETGVKG